MLDRNSIHRTFPEKRTPVTMAQDPTHQVIIHGTGWSMEVPVKSFDEGSGLVRRILVEQKDGNIIMLTQPGTSNPTCFFCTEEVVSAQVVPLINLTSQIEQSKTTIDLDHELKRLNIQFLKQTLKRMEQSGDGDSWKG